MSAYPAPPYDVIVVDEECFYCNRELVKASCEHGERIYCSECEREVHEEVISGQWCTINSHVLERTDSNE